MRKLDNKTIVVASHNAGKISEIAALIEPLGFTASSAAALNFDVPVETGTTFEKNAAIKALASANKSGLPALADDSGICVDALDGQPGVYTADWAENEDGSRDFDMAMEKVEAALAKKGANTPEKRTARFVCVLCLAWPDGHTETFRGEVEGTLVWPPRGVKGHGYDPVFQPSGHNKTFAQMGSDEKSNGGPQDGGALSHRARAFRLLVDTGLSL